MTDRFVTHADFVLDRYYDAPPARVFAAFGDAVAKNRWFAAVDDGSDTPMELDFRVGGGERTTFANTPDGPVLTYEAVFHDIVPDTRIVLTNRMLSDDTRIAVNLVSIEFAPEGTGTRLTLTDHGAYLDGHDRADWREEGTSAQLDRLVVELGAQAAAQSQ